MVTQKITRAASAWAKGDRSKLKLGNLQARRDWGFAGDYVKAMHAMLQQSAPKDYVIGTGESHSVAEFLCQVLKELNGCGVHVRPLLRRLDRSRFRPHFVCSPGVTDKLRPDTPDDGELIALDLLKPGHVGAAIRLARVLRQRRIGILHSHLFFGSLFASPIGW